MRNGEWTGSKFFVEEADELRRKLSELQEQNKFLLDRVQDEQDRFQELLKDYKKLEIKVKLLEQSKDGLAGNK